MLRRLFMTQRSSPSSEVERQVVVSLIKLTCYIIIKPDLFADLCISLCLFSLSFLFSLSLPFPAPYLSPSLYSSLVVSLPSTRRSGCWDYPFLRSHCPRLPLLSCILTRYIIISWKAPPTPGTFLSSASSSSARYALHTETAESTATVCAPSVKV